MGQVTQLRLPAEKPSMERFGRLSQADRDKLLEGLLGAVWESDENGTLPVEIANFVKGWIAHIRFEENPENVRYREELQERTSA